MINLGPVGQIHLLVNDIQAAVRFYRDDLGIPFLFDVPPQKMAFFDCGGVRLFLGEPEANSELEPGAGSVIYFRVDSCRKAHADMAARGVKFDHEPHIITRMGGIELWMAFFKDPSGNVLSIMSEEPVT